MISFGLMAIQWVAATFFGEPVGLKPLGCEIRTWFFGKTSIFVTHVNGSQLRWLNDDRAESSRERDWTKRQFQAEKS